MFSGLFKKNKKNSIQKSSKKGGGFTLVELIIAVAVFSMASLIATDIFITTSRVHRKTAYLQKVQSDLELILGMIQDEVRSGTIDYDFYGTITNPEDYLVIRNELNQQVVFRKSSSNFGETVCPDELSTPCLEVSRDGGLAWASVSSKDVKLQSLNFYIGPATTPFERAGGAYLTNIQPRVTINLGIQSSSLKAIEQTTIFLQTTVSSRYYVR